jgi:hypothetical protein
LVDKLFNSSEKRLARVLLLLAHLPRTGGLKLRFPKSVRRLWQRWWERPARESTSS